MTHPRAMRVLGIALVFAFLIYHFHFLGDLLRPPRRLQPQQGKMIVMVTGAAGYIGSHATLQLLEAGHAVVAVDNLSRGNRGAIEAVARLSAPNRLAFLELDLDDRQGLREAFRSYPVNLVMHFAAIAFVGESVAEPLRYYHNVTSNTVTLLEAMNEAKVQQLVYSSTCATYGGVPKEAVPVTEATPAKPNNPYGWSKWMAEQAIRDYAKANPALKVAILRYFNVYGADPEGRIGEYPRPELRHHGRISGACFDAALGKVPSLKIMGTNHPTRDGSCIRDYIHVVDLIDAHIKVSDHLTNPPALYNVGTGKGVTVKEFVQACLKVTKREIKVIEQPEARPGDYAEMWAITSKITEEIGWQARYTNVEEGLEHGWSWRSKHPNGY